MPGTLSEQDRQARRSMVDGALGTLRLEGLKPSDDVIALADRFVAGEITFEELDHGIERLLSTRQVHVS
ncbi:MAG: antitoxin VbhA family protein [Bryobacteraceae bacterium]